MLTRVFLLFIFMGTLFVSCTSSDEEVPVELSNDSILIRDAWARPAAQGMMGGAYLTILNGTEATDTLTGITSEAAAMTEVHESYLAEDGMSGMRPAESLTVEARSALELSPGGYHIMLMQLNQDLAPGDSVSVTLHFSQYGPVEIQIPITEQPPMQK